MLITDEQISNTSVYHDPCLPPNMNLFVPADHFTTNGYVGRPMHGAYDRDQTSHMMSMLPSSPFNLAEFCLNIEL